MKNAINTDLLNVDFNELVTTFISPAGADVVVQLWLDGATDRAAYMVQRVTDTESGAPFISDELITRDMTSALTEYSKLVDGELRAYFLSE